MKKIASVILLISVLFTCVLANIVYIEGEIGHEKNHHYDTCYSVYDTSIE